MLEYWNSISFPEINWETKPKIYADVFLFFPRQACIMLARQIWPTAGNTGWVKVADSNDVFREAEGSLIPEPCSFFEILSSICQ